SSRSSETSLSSVIADWDELYRRNPAQSTLTSERFEGLSKSIKEIDPVFHRQWVEAILNNYPTLDRIVNAKK
ncbi:MAG: hypothetical protein JWM99_2128, partial [Verrucomicrobiales bacterium]|nr:hypothetical protein [Verrucomicrobiales bacterium]